MQLRVDLTTRRARRGTATAAGPRAGRIALLIGGLAALLAASIAHGAAGLQVDQLRLEGEAKAGVAGRVTVSNPSAETVKVTMTPRRWRQGADGKLLADPRRAAVLQGIGLSTKSFTLAPRAKRTVEVAVRKTPRSHYLYAALVARGTSTSTKAGLRPAYEIAVALSLRPPKRYQRYRISVSRPRVRKRKGGGILLDTVVRNRGNMVDPITGSFTVRGTRVTRTVKVRGPLGILPGKRVRLPAAAVRGLRAGRYRVTVSVVQANGGRPGRGTIAARFGIGKGGRVTR